MCRHLYFAFIGIFLLFFLFSGCRKEEYWISDDMALRFSTDTIHFDTVFSGVGSITHHLKVFNPYSKKVKVSQISLAGKEGSTPFRLNINGVKSNSLMDVEIRSRDSMYIFIETTVKNPDDIILAKDSIVFITNGVFQDVKLLAWGKAVHRIPGNLIIENDTTLQTDKPYLFIGNLEVKEGVELHLEAGTELYFERGKGLIVNGRLRASGTIEDPVIIRSSRIDKGYKDVPGLWNGVHFVSSDSLVLKNVRIAQAVTALTIYPDNTSGLHTPVSLYNVQLLDNSYGGIVAKKTDVNATNLLINNSGYYAIKQSGGEHHYYHTSIANYHPSYYSIRTTPSVLVSSIIGTGTEEDTELSFYNSIIYGNNQNELSVHPDATKVTYHFSNCLLRIEKASFPTDDPLIFNTVLFNHAPKFISLEDYNYRLKSSSPAIDFGNSLYLGDGIFDMDGHDKTLDENPDAGAYEYTED